MNAKHEPRMTPLEVARSVFPDPRATDDQLEYLIWNETSYPFCMTNNPASEFMRQLQDYKDQWEQVLAEES